MSNCYWDEMVLWCQVNWSAAAAAGLLRHEWASSCLYVIIVVRNYSQIYVLSVHLFFLHYGNGNAQ